MPRADVHGAKDVVDGSPLRGAPLGCAPLVESPRVEVRDPDGESEQAEGDEGEEEEQGRATGLAAVNWMDVIYDIAVQERWHEFTADDMLGYLEDSMAEALADWVSTTGLREIDRVYKWALPLPQRATAGSESSASRDDG